MLALTFSYYLIPVTWTIAYYAIYNYVVSNQVIAVLVGFWIAYLSTYPASIAASKKDGYIWRSFQRLKFWKKLAKKHTATIEVETALDDSQQYIFCSFPHGTASFSHFLTFSDGCGMLSRVHKGDRRDLAASVLFLIPFFKEFCFFMGCVDASAPTAHYNLKKNRSLLIFIGGEKEQLMTKPNQQKIFLKSRKGFVKLAIQYGAHLVPMYTFGENELYSVSDLFRGKPTNFSEYVTLEIIICAYKEFRDYLERKFHVGIALFWGKYGTWIPHDKELHCEIGKPIVVEKVKKEDITEEMIDKLHSEFMSEMKRLFDRTKTKYPEYANQELEII